ncbi:hypothetical protein [Gorillibacterium sp. sgz5001074]|uniref:hypothetical protein n=1 Tax=Gorillibacterium sp. sgz5001074 TaxID=3446695 RepID=UPI003F66D6AC
MKILKLVFLLGLLAAFFPYAVKDRESGAKPDRKKEKRAYLVLATAGLSLGIMDYLDWLPLIARWMDRAMEVLFQATGGTSV